MPGYLAVKTSGHILKRSGLTHFFFLKFKDFQDKGFEAGYLEKRKDLDISGSPSLPV